LALAVVEQVATTLDLEPQRKVETVELAGRITAEHSSRPPSARLGEL